MPARILQRRGGVGSGGGVWGEELARPLLISGMAASEKMKGERERDREGTAAQERTGREKRRREVRGGATHDDESGEGVKGDLRILPAEATCETGRVPAWRILGRTIK
jgi:hypothetical protein